MIIGITGGTGCGKTTALDAIRELGGVVLDCDAIYHTLLQTDKSLLAAIDARFPGTVENGQLQRKKLGSVVFGDPAAMADLNRITHDSVCQEVRRRLEPAPKLAAIDAIRLLESGLDQLCDLTVAVTAPEEVRVARLMERDGITADYARSRIQAQRPQSEYAALCDYVLENDSTREAFRKKCLAFFREQVIIKENS